MTTNTPACDPTGDALPSPRAPPPPPSDAGGEWRHVVPLARFLIPTQRLTGCGIYKIRPRNHWDCVNTVMQAAPVDASMYASALASERVVHRYNT
jgi:hypothetical protein